jgi:hypothetical protein
MPLLRFATTIRRVTARGYAAVWEDGSEVLVGRIQLGPRELVFEGAGAGRPASCRIPYRRIASLFLGRSPSDRIGGRPALVLELGDGDTVRVAAPELGALHELEEALRNRKLRDES